MKRQSPSQKAGERKKAEHKASTGKIGGFGTGVSEEKASWKAGLKAAKESVQSIGGIKPDMSFVAIRGDYDAKAVLKGVSKAVNNAPVVGVIPHGVIFTEDSVSTEGIAVASISSDIFQFQIGTGRNLFENPEKAVQDAISPILDQFVTRKAEGYDNLLIYFIVDTYKNGDAILELVSRKCDEVEDIIPFVGTVLDVTGKVSKETGLITDGELLNNAIVAIGVYSKFNIGVGYGHGLYPLVPKRATAVSGDTIVELDGKPAYNVWKEYLVKKGNDEQDINANPGKYLSRFLFGIPVPSSPRNPRIRIALGVTEDGGIKLSGNVKENSTIWLMEAREERMLDSAGNAVIQAIEDLRGNKPMGGFIFSSIIRFLNLGDKFFDEIALLQRKMAVPLLGFTSSGEFYKPTSTIKWYHNSSALISILPE